MKIEFSVSSDIKKTARVAQVESMFDCPLESKTSVSWNFDLPIETDNWQIGAIIGPSGSGKSSVLSRAFGDPTSYEWGNCAVVDAFDKRFSLSEIVACMSSVGFNTVPAWVRPYSVLSNGEKFRVDLARAVLETEDTIIVDEFTSVVDRQVAQVGSHAVQKLIRKTKKKLVVASCHYDIVDWLQPDWVLDMATSSFTRRLLQRRPVIDAKVCRVPYSEWSRFSKFHYMSSDLHRAARCFALFVGDKPVAFVGALHRPHPKADDIMGVSRLVTLPDWQGLGLSFVLVDAVGAAYKKIGKRLHMYPAHPGLIRSYDRSPTWALVAKPGLNGYASVGSSSSLCRGKDMAMGSSGRPSATFRYVGPAMLSTEEAIRFIEGRPTALCPPRSPRPSRAARPG